MSILEQIRLLSIGWRDVLEIAIVGYAIYRVLLLLERLTFATADLVIATNESVRGFALGRGRVPERRLFVVRTGPDFNRLKIVPADPTLKRGANYLVCYVGVMGPQDGVDYAIRAAESVVHGARREDLRQRTGPRPHHGR